MTSKYFVYTMLHLTILLSITNQSNSCNPSFFTPNEYYNDSSTITSSDNNQSSTIPKAKTEQKTVNTKNNQQLMPIRIGCFMVFALFCALINTIK